MRTVGIEINGAGRKTLVRRGRGRVDALTHVSNTPPPRY